MRRAWCVLFLILGVFLLIAKTDSAKTALRVDERSSRLSFDGDKATLALAIINPGARMTAARVSIEIVEPSNAVIAKSQTEANLSVGASVVRTEFALSVSQSLLWDRVRYRVAPLSAADGPAVEGLVSASEITPDIFALEIIKPGIAAEGRPCRILVRASHPVSARAVARVQVHAEIKFEGLAAPLKADGVTDDNGYAALGFDLPNTLKSEGEISVTGNLNGLVDETEASLRVDRTARVWLSTDKMLYQPGQSLHARAILLDPSKRAIPSAEMTLKILNPDQEVVHRATMKTSRFGVASTDWAIPPSVRLGDYTIRIDRDESDDEDVYAPWYKVRISRYDLPNFTVNVKPDRGFYLPGQNARVEVRGDYLFGQPVTRGHVRVVRETDREWNYEKQKWDITEEETYEGDFDRSGRYVAHLDLTKGHSELKEHDYERMKDVRYAAYITDQTTNRTEQRRFDLRLSKEPIHVYVIEDDMRVPDAPLYFYVSTFYADGSPAECEVDISQARASDPPNSHTARDTYLRTVRTDRYGIAKVAVLEVASREKPKEMRYGSDVELRLTARDRRHQFGHHDESLWFSSSDSVHVETNKAVYRPGEPIEVEVTSTKPASNLFLSIAQGTKLIRSENISLATGRGHITLPYAPDFTDELTITAYGYPQGAGFVVGARTVLYPRNHELKLDLRTSEAIYRPGQEAITDFQVTAADGRAVESAIGVSVVDRAVEERARTDSEFGDRYGGSFDRLWGDNADVGGITRASLDRLDLSKPIDGHLQLVAEVLLRSSARYWLDVQRGDSYRSSPDSVFQRILKSQLKPIEAALFSRYARTRQYPKDEAMLNKALLEFGIDFAHMRDPWGTPFSVLKSVRVDRDVLAFVSAGPDKQLHTSDDFTVSEMSWPYVQSSGEAIDRAVREYHQRTGAFIRNAPTLERELHRYGLHLNDFKDPWKRRYRYEFGINASSFTINIRCGGANGRFEAKQNGSDDFTVWTSRIDYFADKRVEIEKALSNYFEATRTFPRQQAELEEALGQERIRFQSLRDPWGHGYYANFKTEYRYGDRVAMITYGTYAEGAKQRTEITPVTQRIESIVLRSMGLDGKKGTADDFNVATHSRIMGEQAAQDSAAKPTQSNVIFTGAKGAIGGVVTDMAGAVIPNTTVRATHAGSGNIYEGKTNDAGRYLFNDIPAGFYEVRFEMTGFKAAVITAVPVRSSNLTELNATLNAGTVTETVNVSAAAPEVQTERSQVSSVITRTPKTPLASIRQLTQTSTPRLREYFPETLVWQPSIETDTSGRARLNFKLADNITTWKMSVIASTVDGEIGSAEKEILAFQPFFIEHDPPRVLTEGDEIALPVVLRNYLDKTQSVNLQIKPESWFTLLSPGTRRAAIPAGDASREVFEFRAIASIDEGKQRLTATGAEANDSIEKPVSVHPFGEEKMDTLTRVFRDSSTLEINIPRSSIRNTVRGELKIYPNLMAHLLEGIEGIMRRPYGCAEQTISSTYPSLMVLRYYKRRGENSPAIAEKAQYYLKAGYERLLNYRKDDGSFSYWGRGEGDEALTAYALRFLSDAREFAAVDEDVIKAAQDWLVKHQRADGSWPLRYSFDADRPQTVSLTSFIARVLSTTAKSNGNANGGDAAKQSQAAALALKRALEFLSHATAELDEPYAIASYALAAINAGDERAAARPLTKLVASAHQEGETSYWALESNTPFYGWGLAGRIEATAVAVQALALGGKEPSNELSNRGLLFLLQKKDRYGVWHSTQATVNVLDALLTPLEKREPVRPGGEATAEIFVNDKQITKVAMPEAQELANPIAVDLSPFLSIGTNRIQIKRPADSQQASAQLTATHYEPWPAASDMNKPPADSAGALKLRVNFDKTSAKIGDEITCSVDAERVGFRGYGMMLAEIGLPPGADVDRASLERMMTDAVWGIDQYDVLPDRLIVYLWPRAGGSRFQFKFRSRFGIAAQTAPSLVYDYYNPEARAIVPPTKFNIK